MRLVARPRQGMRDGLAREGCSARTRTKYRLSIGTFCWTVRAAWIASTNVLGAISLEFNLTV
jgi:hypothetical protein